MDDFHHGVRVIEVKGGARTVRAVATSVIGVVCTSTDADAATFPIDRPVVLTDVRRALAKAGKTGTLRPTLQAISDQCNTPTIVVRVPTGSDDAATTSAVIGSAEGASFTGLYALLAAQAQLGVRPRILGAPGLDTQPVAVALAVIAKRLRAMAYVSAAASATKEDAVLYRKNFAQRELMVIWPDFVSFDTTTSTAHNAYATARALGLRAMIDQEQGWHKSLSNVAVAGVTGLSRDVFWDLQDPSTDAGYLNAGDVTTLINSNGYRFWGSRTCSDDPQFAFEPFVRTAHVVADTLAEISGRMVDGPLTTMLVRDILDEGNARFRDWTRRQYLIGGQCWFDDELNSKERLFSGKLSLAHNFTPVPPAEDITLYQSITDTYFQDFANRLVA
ncbi:phage tail sheath protein [Lysobacter sp. K5869]|uniref:phage tail sheath protein n=1 Tax=Lysobacter sp. K5869 TaxID=2820808 RepID=UPI001C063C42|nr:phage tail sheath protein [Lysobacter sp. K5869]QWP76078.1 phage tail sheath protein [Lysobacter sp. K5869]